MSRSHIVIDGLWRCLSPSVDVRALSRALNFARHPTRRPACLRHSRIASDPQNQCQRALHTTPRRRSSHESSGISAKNDESIKRADETRAQYLIRVAKRNPWVPRSFFEANELTEQLNGFSTPTIYEALRALQNLEDNYDLTVRLVEYLVKERGEQPNELLYETLIRANVDPHNGSADVARSLVKEMIAKGIQTTPGVYQALLEVTAVHPDYILRSSALRDMKNRWYSPSVSGTTSIIVGLLRDGQYELALEKLEESYKSAMVIPPWLYHIFVFVFGELGFHDESFQILQHQLKIYGPNQSMAIWQFLLDVYSRDAFYLGITYIWHHMVTPGKLNPADGTAVNVLNAASSYGDTELVTSVMRMLTDRGKRLDLHHYEALVHAHTLNQDIRKALNVLCIMGRTGLAPDSSSTRSIYQMLRHSPSETEEAQGILHELRQQYPVPIAAFNVVLEAKAAHRGFNRALDMYRGVRHICAAGPDLATYHILLRHCTKGRSMKFLLDEMDAFSIRPNRTTYDRIVLICSLQIDYELTFAYLRRMEEEAGGGWWISKGPALALIRRCIQAEDTRVQDIIEKCRRHGMDIDADVRKLVRKVKEANELKMQLKLKQQQQQHAEADGAAVGTGAVATLPPPPVENRLAQSMLGSW